jgi:hypothetical protein
MAAVAIAMAFVAFELTLAAFGPYGYFVDEFYYIACSKRLAWGYVDHPPLSIGILAATRAVIGTSVPAVRVPAALAVGGSIALTACVARLLGGGRYAQSLAALCVAVSSMALVMASFYSMNAFELLFWPGLVLALAGAANGSPRAGWLAAGVLMGLGLENKHTMILPAAALSLGLVATPLRSAMRTRWPWIGMAIAVLLFLPNVAWQAAHGFPSLEFYRNAQLSKNVPTPIIAAVLNQVLVAGPGTCVVWIAGLVWLSRADAAKNVRFLGIAFVVLFLLQVVSGSSRPDRIGAMYPAMFAAGAVAIEDLTRQRLPAIRVAVPILAVIGALVVIPISLPLLRPRTAARLAEASGIFPRIERGKGTSLPQLLADRTGWDRFVAEIASVYRSLPSAERDAAVVYCRTYGCAGAVELLGGACGLPRAISAHNSYWTWGPGQQSPPVLIAVGFDGEELDALFASHEVAKVYRCDDCMTLGRAIPIQVARTPRVPLDTAWQALKHFN